MSEKKKKTTSEGAVSAPVKRSRSAKAAPRARTKAGTRRLSAPRPPSPASRSKASAAQTTGAGTAPLRLAVIATVYRYLSHAQHFVDRFLVGYPYEGEWRRSNTRVVSLYVDQTPEGDQSVDRGREFGFGVYPSISQALRCGGRKLAVDGVLIIGEHGDYPSNELGQIQYPRYEMFKECVEVFEADGRSVPIYNDKHLSYSFDKAQQMVADGHRLGFPILAGSSLPVTWRLPDLELPYDCDIEEALMIGVGGSDAMDYHALEAMQCMIERRRGGETGVASVQLIEGKKVWKAGEDGRWSKRLLEAALSRSDSPQGLTHEDGRTQDLLGSGELMKLVKDPAAYLIEFRDGLKATLLMINGAVSDFNFAAKLRGQANPVSCQFFLTPTPNVTYSACLVAKIDEMLTTGVAPFPAERTMIVNGILESCLRSKHGGHKKLKTPHLNVSYRGPKESHHGRR
tara:strand:- start:2930 stop:4297 length:1368 start_codon:yes stop_codon:yes gene_type:complete